MANDLAYSIQICLSPINLAFTHPLRHFFLATNPDPLLEFEQCTYNSTMMTAFKSAHDRFLPRFPFWISISKHAKPLCLYRFCPCLHVSLVCVIVAKDNKKNNFEWNRCIVRKYRVSSLTNESCWVYNLKRHKPPPLLEKWYLLRKV